MPTTKRLVVAIFSALILCGILGYSYYKKIFLPNVPSTLEESYLYIPNGASFAMVKDSLAANGFLKDTKSFEWVAHLMKFDNRDMRAGRFEIAPGWSNRTLIQHLRSERQSPVMVVLNNERLPEDVAAKAARFIEPDSAMIYQAMMNPVVLDSIGQTPETVMSIFIPNSYQLYWNSTAEEFIYRMKKEHDKFWNTNNRNQKAAALNLTPENVYTLASIVEKETNYNPEKARMAGVYFNRIKKGMLLQADPTCVFARRDFSAKRVTDYHTKFDSPYNTYMYKGLPPGPISMASIASIDAVLSPEEHDYIFYCAKPNDVGQHSFAKTLAGHNQNARLYYRWYAANR